MSAMDLIATASNAVFAGRTHVLIFKTAQNVASESPDTPNHADRVRYASFCMLGREKPQLVALHVICSNPTIMATINGAPEQLGANVPDGDIEFALSSIWTARSVAYVNTPA